MEMEIRTYRAQDSEQVIALWNEALPPNAPHNDPATSIRKKVEADPGLFFVAVVDGAIAGTAMGGYDGHRGWLYSVAVAPKVRRQGVGAALIGKVESELILRGCLKINLQVRTSNAGVIAFYRKLGYAVDEVLSMGKRLYE